MSLPPPLPGAQPRPATTFITVVGWLCLVTGVLGLAYSLVQVIGAAMLPDDHVLRLMAPMAGDLPELPPLMAWYYANTLWIGVLGLLVSALMVAIGRALLRRHEWARKGFIAVLVLGTAMQLAWIWALPQFIEGTLVLQGASLPPGMEMPPELAVFMRGIAALGAVMLLLFAALHAWLVWKLCTVRVRAEFAGTDPG